MWSVCPSNMRRDESSMTGRVGAVGQKWLQLWRLSPPARQHSNHFAGVSGKRWVSGQIVCMEFGVCPVFVRDKSGCTCSGSVCGGTWQ